MKGGWREVEWGWTNDKYVRMCRTVCNKKISVGGESKTLVFENLSHVGGPLSPPLQNTMKLWGLLRLPEVGDCGGAFLSRMSGARC